MELETLNDIKNLITSDTETDKIEFKKTTGQLERGNGKGRHAGPLQEVFLPSFKHG